MATPCSAVQSMTQGGAHWQISMQSSSTDYSTCAMKLENNRYSDRKRQRQQNETIPDYIYCARRPLNQHCLRGSCCVDQRPTQALTTWSILSILVGRIYMASDTQKRPNACASSHHSSESDHNLIQRGHNTAAATRTWSVTIMTR